MLATERDCLKYIAGTTVARPDLELALVEASEWVVNHVELNGSVPPYVQEATALLASILVHHPEVLDDEAQVPNAVRLMLAGATYNP